MKNTISRIIIISGLFPFLANQAFCQVLNTSLPFLNIGPDAYSLGISEARTATLTGAADIYSNPANLAMEEKSSLSASYTFWIADTRISHASVNFRRKNDAIAFGILTSSVNNLEARQQPGPANGTFSMQDFSIAAAYARRFGPLSVGANIMYLYEQFYQQNAGGYAFSAGTSVNLLQKRLRLAASVRNIGRMGILNDTRSELPANFNFGAHTKIIQFSTPGNTEIPVLISASADYTKPLKNRALTSNTSTTAGLNSLQNGFVSAGLNVSISELIDLRGGYRFEKNAARSFSAGLGLITNGIHIDFAFVPFETGYGNAYSVGLRYYF